MTALFGKVGSGKLNRTSGGEKLSIRFWNQSQKVEDEKGNDVDVFIPVAVPRKADSKWGYPGFHLFVMSPKENPELALTDDESVDIEVHAVPVTTEMGKEITLIPEDKALHVLVGTFKLMDGKNGPWGKGSMKHGLLWHPATLNIEFDKKGAAERITQITGQPTLEQDVADMSVTLTKSITVTGYDPKQAVKAPASKARVNPEDL